MSILGSEEAQRAICAKYRAGFLQCGPDDRAGVAVTTLSREPLYGVRKQNSDGTSSWYIWGGEYSTAPDFYQPLCAGHLKDMLPIVLPYLGLPAGWKFIIDRAGYEDVWCEKEANKSPETNALQG